MVQRRHDNEKAPDSAERATAPVQVRITGVLKDVDAFAEFVTSFRRVSASPITLRPRSHGVTQGYMTVHIEGEST